MYLKLPLIALGLFVSLFVNAQTCVTSSRNPWEWPGNNHWFVAQFSGSPIGGAQLINFTGGFSKTPLTQNMAVYEGTAAASNDQGALVLLTNGKYAWDAAGNITSTTIKEGDEAGGSDPLNGGKHSGSASQGVMSVRHPLQPNKYYVVAVGDVIGGGAPGVNYNVFDETGTEIQGPTSLGVIPCEGIDATLHENGVDVWVTILEYGSTNFHSFLLTCNGFITPGVTSSVGDARTGDAGRGGLAFSPDGTKMTACFPTGWPDAAKQISVYDFNRKTGKLTNRQNIAPTNVVVGPYDCIWSKDGSSVIVTGGLTGKANSINVTTGVFTADVGNIGGGSHTVQIGGDGNYYFSGADGVKQWSGSGNAVTVDDATGWGLPTIYIPPAEEPDIQEVAARCDTFPDFDLHTYWLCSGISSEDSINSTHSYFLLDSNDASGATVDPNSSTILGEKTGIFSPSKAGPGMHKVVFVYCGVNDTIEVEITQCASCIDTLVNTTPEICAGPGATLNLSTLVDTANGKGYWTFGAVPSTPTTAAFIDSSTTDTLFSAVDLATSPGSYKMIYTVTYAGLECKDSINIIVNKPPVISVNDSAICAGNPDALFTAVSDSAVQTYSWADNGSGSGATTSGSVAGIYSVTVTDVNGCVGKDTGTLVVNVLPVISVNDSTICKGGAPAMFTATSDTTAANYLWMDNGSGTNSTTTGVTEGIYTVLVIDKNGCVGRDTGNLYLNELPVVAVNNDTICDGDPAATFTATSDSVAQSYVWTELGSGTNSTTTGTAVGMYAVEVTDVNGCIGKDTGYLKVNILPVVTVNDSAICAGDPAALFTAVSDSAVASYTWSGLGTGVNPTTSGTSAGLYTVDIVDVNGCLSSGNGTLITNKLPVVSVNDDEICIGGNAATFTATVDSAVSTYTWTLEGTGTNQTTTGTTAGKYAVSIIDVNGCAGKDTGTLVVHDLPVVTLSGGNVCPNTPFTLSPVVTTLNTPYTTSWSTGETTPTIQKGQGSYTVTITDAKNCINTADTVVIEDPNLTVTLNGPIDLCQGEDSLIISNYKAVDGYSFAWTRGADALGNTESITVNSSGTYQVDVNKGNCQGSNSVDVIVHALPIVTVADKAICNGDAAATFDAVSTTATQYLWSENGTGTAVNTTGATAGNYTVEITDVNGCKDSATAVLTVNALPSVTVNSEEICAGDPAATFTATSATATGYTWSVNGNGTSQTTTGTTAGLYTVEVSDANNCKTTASGTLIVNKLPVVSVNDATMCEGDGAKTFTATVDSAVQTYAWSNLGTGSGASITGDQPGIYTVNVVDVNGCTGSDDGVLTVQPLPVVKDSTFTICEGDPSVLAGEDVTGPSTSYAYLWTNTGNNETTSKVAFSSGGLFTRKVTSLEGCISYSTYRVTENVKPDISIQDGLACDLDPMTLRDERSTTGFSYVWTPGNLTGSSIQPTTNQVYNIIKTNDATGCFQTATASATFIPIPTVDIVPDTVTICRGDQAVLNVTHDANSISWSNGSRANTITVLNQGIYTVTGTNGNCPATDNVFVEVLEYPVSQLNKAIGSQPICFEELDTLVLLTAHNDRAYTYLWNTGETTASIEIAAEGTYSVDITNEMCTVSDEVTLKDFCPWTLYVPNAFTPEEGSGDGLNDVFYARGTNIVEFTMYIYDRWGIKLFESNDIHSGWDGYYKGRLAQIDVYVWKIEFTVEEISGSLKDYSRIGTVTLVQ